MLVEEINEDEEMNDIDVMCDINIHLDVLPEDFKNIDEGDVIDEDLLKDFFEVFTKYYPKFELCSEIFLQDKDEDDNYCHIQFTSTDENMESNVDDADADETLTKFLRDKYSAKDVEVSFCIYDHIN